MCPPVHKNLTIQLGHVLQHRISLPFTSCNGKEQALLTLLVSSQPDCPCKKTSLSATGFNTQMSRVIPPQWDKFGYTFWIPSQVEPTVAMIGSSLPALRTHIFSRFQGLTSTLRSFWGLKSTYTSGFSEDAAEERPKRDYVRMGGSDPALHTDYELETITPHC